MALVGAREQFGIKQTGVNAVISNNPRARLMYYLKCMAVVLDLSSEAALRRLTDYEKHYLLDDEDEVVLLALCVALSPDELIGKCIFPVDDDAMNGSNDFLELSSTRTQFLASSSVLIGGTQRRVAKIMVFKEVWIENNYLSPIQSLLQRHADRKRTNESSDGCCCAIL